MDLQSPTVLWQQFCPGSAAQRGTSCKPGARSSARRPAASECHDPTDVERAARRHVHRARHDHARRTAQVSASTELHREVIIRRWGRAVRIHRSCWGWDSYTIGPSLPFFRLVHPEAVPHQNAPMNQSGPMNSRLHMSCQTKSLPGQTEPRPRIVSKQY